VSLLPGEILPQSVPLGTSDGQGNVTISTNWWLLIYNIALNSIGNGGSIPDTALEIWTLNQIDAATVTLKPAAQPVEVIPVGTSPFTYTAPFDGSVAVTGPMESASSASVPSIVLTRQGTSVNTGFLNGSIPVRRGDEITLTYLNSVAPTMTFLPS
jgi:hypothetical protein